MKKYGTLFACLLALGLLSQGHAKPITPVPETKDKDNKDVNPKRIESLVKQLGAQLFRDREAAEKELEAIGAPVVDYLRRTMKDAEPEVSRRAAEIIRRLDEKAVTANILAPKKVKLSLKDVTVLEAVAELRRQSGYVVQVEGDQTALANRKI